MGRSSKWQAVLVCVVALAFHADRALAYDWSAVDARLEQAVAAKVPEPRCHKRTTTAETCGLELRISTASGTVYDRVLGTQTAGEQLPIASSSKWLTAATIMTLVDDGTVGSLDDPVSDYLPGWDIDKSAVTIRQLLSHTSGLPPQQPCLNVQVGITLQQCAAAIAATPLAAEPGTTFLYGGTGLQVAAAVAEAATGQSWAQLFEDRVADPIGMTDTVYGAAIGGFSDTQNPQVAGGAETTADDYDKFLEMLDDNDGTVLSASSVTAMEHDNATGLTRLDCPETANPTCDEQTTGEVGFLTGNPDPEHVAYGLGNWLYGFDEGASSASPITSPGAYGTYPWIDRGRGYRAILFQDDTFSDARLLFKDLRPLIEEQICGSSCVSAAHNDTAQPVGCSWPLLGNSDTLNVAFPDEAARYWVAVLPAGPTVLRVRVTGEYARARYFSLHAYDASQRPVGAIADHELDPDVGSTNPFRTYPDSGPTNYTAYVEFADKPAAPAANTLYTGAGNPIGALIYRVYVPDDPNSSEGSVPLPDLALERADGSTEVVKLGRCDPLSPSAGGQANSTINQTTFPNAAPRPVPWVRAEDPPYFDRAGGLGASFEDDVPPNPVTDPLFEGDAASFLSNTHNAYVRGSFARRFGDVFVVRAKAPTFPDTRGGDQVATTDAQLRYWSVCMNEFATQRYVECISDYEAVLDADGWMTFVVADPDDRPANADAAHGINFLPWPGAYYDGLLLYRHMLPAADFDEAVQRQEVATPITTEMGDYGLVARYCTKSTIEDDGVDACFT